MNAPRSRYQGPALLMGLLLGLGGPPLARADEKTADPVPSQKHVLPSGLHATNACQTGEMTSQQRQQMVMMLLASTAIVSPFSIEPPPDNPPPMVVKPPPDNPPTTTEYPPGEKPPPKSTPEPASLVMGLCGAGMAYLAWRRKRRNLGQAETDEVADPLPEGMALDM